MVHFEIVFVALQNLLVYSVYFQGLSDILFCTGDNSDLNDFWHFRPARMIVRWVAVPVIPSHSVAFLNNRLVCDPESIIASISTRVPPKSITLKHLEIYHCYLLGFLLFQLKAGPWWVRSFSLAIWVSRLPLEPNVSQNMIEKKHRVFGPLQTVLPI